MFLTRAVQTTAISTRHVNKPSHQATSGASDLHQHIATRVSLRDIRWNERRKSQKHHYYSTYMKCLNRQN